ncbi:MAG: hypothetical protein AAGD34_08820 [Pseudomonadota bacterium]
MSFPRTITGTAIAGLALALFAAPAPSAAQSFDCANATEADEKAICASGRLSALDDEMAALYHDIETHAMMGTSGDVRDNQEEFLKRRATCGSDDKCLSVLYHERIASLKQTKEEVGQGAAD